MPLLSRNTNSQFQGRRQTRVIKSASNLRNWFRGTIGGSLYVEISQETRIIPFRLPMDDRKDRFQRHIIDFLSEYLAFENFEVNWLFSDIEFYPAGTIPPPPKKHRRMRENEPLNLSVNLFQNIIDIKTSDNNCVVDTLTHQYPAIAKLKRGNPIENLKEANVEEIMEFCNKYKIRAIAYDINKNVIAENIPDNDQGKYKILAFIYHNNHMYLLDVKKNKYLVERPEAKNIVEESAEMLESHFLSILNKGELPSHIKIQSYKIVSFQHEDVIYFNNPDYKECFNICKTFMFSDKVPWYASLSMIVKLIEPLYSCENIQSFLPINHIKPAFYYNKELDTKREIQTIDKCKMYSYVLRNLKYLLSTDIRTYQHSETNTYIDEYCLYIATPKSPNILMPKQDIYSGFLIKYCKGKFEFTIQEVLKCKKHTNLYQQLIDDIYAKLPESTGKTIINRAIGMFQKEPSVEGEKVEIVNEENKEIDRFNFEVGNGYYAQVIPEPKIKNLYNQKPIAIQIKDGANILLFEKMEELKLTDDDVVQINTDSITFYSKPNLDLKLSKSFNDWKAGEYNNRMTTTIYDNSPPFRTFKTTIKNNNEIITGYAGNGKSYHIQNKMDLTDAIILSSKHSAIRQHREKGFNAEVIQKYASFMKNQPTIFPKEKHIIIEECGILTRDHWDYLHKCILLGKKLTLFGDFNQLLPVNEIYTFNRPLYINMVFSTQTQKLDNYRNNFTQEYYDSLINSTDENYLKQEILKYSTKNPEDADVIIAYTNNMVDKYNNYMLNYHNKQITDADVPVMCITNEFRNKGMYNNFLFKSQEIDPEILTDEKYFRPAYARTLYNMQGDDCKSYYIAPEDISWFLNPRMAYTLISRLKITNE